MLVTDFDFELPPSAIAVQPAEPRDHARLFVHDRVSRRDEHAHVFDLPRFLRPGDLLVLNDTKVMPWRLRGRRATGGAVECLLVQVDVEAGEAFVKPSNKLRVGERVAMEGGAIELELRETLGGGRWRVGLRAATGTVASALERCGRAPLPPYIARDGAEDVQRDRERYQTVYARAPGAIAAPTAGLHFTPELLQRIAAMGVQLAYVTLHVGEGTFAPMRSDVVEEHRMHSERYELPPATAAAIAATRARGGRVVAVGTTSCRTLETCADGKGGVVAGAGASDLFLRPGSRFQVVDALFTNFHLPKSKLVMMVAAFAGRDEVLARYREAVARGYRFYSFGDAMLLV
ncbi:MAG: tRNA preQ1(34) S-adenosylmethionine ribosyltransferase-isomerase QueA [Planctomycetota bacterium]